MYKKKEIMTFERKETQCDVEITGQTEVKLKNESEGNEAKK